MFAAGILLGYLVPKDTLPGRAIISMGEVDP
jgi:hypothetical protein